MSAKLSWILRKMQAEKIKTKNVAAAEITMLVQSKVVPKQASRKTSINPAGGFNAISALNDDGI